MAMYLVEKFLEERIPIIGSFIGLQRFHNDGIAFGMQLGQFQDLAIFSALILVGYLAFKTAKSRLDQIGYGMILGGGIANVIDRLIDGVVTDMIQVGAFPIFNIADVCINIGLGLLLLQVVLGRRRVNG